MKKIVIKKIHACGKINFSSNVNEVIRSVLNSSFFFFYEKILHAPKAPKTPKAPKAPKAQRRNQAKTQSAASKQKKMHLKTSKEKKVTHSLICVFIIFVRAKKRE